MNTAVPVLQSDGVEHSPRKQGAGLANVGHAVTTPVWLSVEGSDLPKAELGDDPEETGIYEFTFTAHNTSDTAQSYWAEASLLTETAQDGLMLQQARALDAPGDLFFRGRDHRRDRSGPLRGAGHRSRPGERPR